MVVLVVVVVVEVVVRKFVVFVVDFVISVLVIVVLHVLVVLNDGTRMITKKTKMNTEIRIQPPKEFPLIDGFHSAIREAIKWGM